MVAAVLASGCGDGDGDDETAEQRETGTATTAAGGRELYLEAGCDSCHGDMAQGTSAGPALPGHSEEAVIRQVRSPLGSMPAYPPSQLGDDQLREIASYIASLEAADEHVEPVDLSNVVAIHHWMALSSLAAGDREDALHHIDHIVERVEGRHLAAMRQARAHLRAGEVHDAEHLIEEMLAGRGERGLSLTSAHLRLALAATQVRDTRGATHHVRHFVDASGGARRRQGREILAQLRGGELHDAEHDLERLLGQAPHDD